VEIFLPKGVLSFFSGCLVRATFQLILELVPQIFLGNFFCLPPCFLFTNGQTLSGMYAWGPAMGSVCSLALLAFFQLRASLLSSPAIQFPFCLRCGLFLVGEEAFLLPGLKVFYRSTNPPFPPLLPLLLLFLGRVPFYRTSSFSPPPLKDGGISNPPFLFP